MQKIFYIYGITSEYIQKIFLGIALQQKRNSKNKLETIEEIEATNNQEQVKYAIKFIGEEKALELINNLIELEEEELVKEIIEDTNTKSSIDYSTPETQAELMDYVLEIKGEPHILDLYSGVGKIDNVILKNHKNVKIDGYEIQETSIQMANLKKYALNNNNINYYKKDLFIENINKKYDYAIADIPFINRYDKRVQTSLEKIAKTLELDLTNRISTTWITVIKILGALEEDGRAVLTTMKGSLFNTLDREVRKKVIEKGYIEAIIDLPQKLLPYTNTENSLIVLNKSKNNKKIKFVDLKECTIMNGKSNIIDLEKAKKALKENAIKVDIDKIRENNFSLNFNIYSGKVKIENGVQLGKISEDIFRGYQITSSEVNEMLVENEEEMNYKILEISNINDDGEICSELKMINSKEKNLDRYLLRNGDIVISARGDKIKKCLINIPYDERIIANGSINVIRVDLNKIKPLYLKMFLDSEKGNITLNNIKSGVTIPSINIGELQKVLVPCPPMDEQLKITEKFEIKLEVIKSTAKRLEELKKELRNLADLI